MKIYRILSLVFPPVEKIEVNYKTAYIHGAGVINFHFCENESMIFSRAFDIIADLISKMKQSVIPV
jgi:hypothetical protein